MAVMTLRGLDDETAKALKERARRDGTSVNAVLVKIVRDYLGMEKKKRGILYDDLNHLAGTWSAGDAADFERNTAAFEKVDIEMWQ